MSTKSTNDLLNKVKDRLKSLQDSSKRTTGTWKPKGTHVIRLLPYKFSDYPFIELYFHYDLFKSNEISPISFGNPDPIVETAEKLKSTGDRESYILSKKLTPKMRTYVPVIVRGEENFGVRYWGFGKEVYEIILKYMNNPEYGNVFDPDTGVDFDLEFIPAEVAGNSFGKITITAKRNSSKLSDNPELVKKWLNGQTPMNEVYKAKTYDELKQMLTDWLDDKSPEEGGEDAANNEEQDPESPAVKTKDTEKSDSVKSAKEKFNELFNKPTK